jgi:hypothetical protein
MRKQTLISIKNTLTGVGAFVLLALIGTYLGWFDKTICAVCTAMAVMIVMLFISTNEGYRAGQKSNQAG